MSAADGAEAVEEEAAGEEAEGQPPEEAAPEPRAPTPPPLPQPGEATDAELPAVLLEPSWAHRGAVPPEAAEQPGAAFDASDRGFSVCAWVRRGEGELEGGRILARGAPPEGWSFEAPSAASGVIAFFASPGPQDPDAEDADAAPPDEAPRDVGATRLDDGAWHCVAVVVSAGLVRAFVDGRPDGELAVEVPRAFGEAPLVLSVGAESAGGPPEGSVKDVKAFDFALSDAQVAGIAEHSPELPTGVRLALPPGGVRSYWAAAFPPEPPVPEEAKAAEGAGDAEGDAAEGEAEPPAEAAEGEAEPPEPEEVVDAEVEAARLAALARELLDDALGLKGGRFQDEVLHEFYVDLLAHAHATELTPRKAAVFVGVAAATLAAMRQRSATSVCVGEPLSVAECLAEYKRLLVAHSFAAAKESTPGSLGIFSLAEAQHLTEFMTGSLFQHYVLYQSVLICPHEMDETRTEVVVAQPRLPPALRRAVPRDRAVGASGRVAASARQGTRSSSAAEEAADADGHADANTDEAAAAEPAEGAEPAAGASEEAAGDPSAEDFTVDEHHARQTAAAETKLAASIGEHDLRLDPEAEQ